MGAFGNRDGILERCSFSNMVSEDQHIGFRNLQDPPSVMRIPGLPAAYYDTSRGVYSDGGAHFTAASSQNLSIASNSTLQTGDIDFFVSFHVYLDSTANQDFISKYQSNSAGSAEYGVTLQGGVPFFYVRGASNLLYAQWSASLSAGQWYHIVAWRDLAAGKIWITVNNGTPVSGNFTQSITANSSAFRLGGNTINGYCNGSIDSVSFWKRKPTSAEITSLNNAGAGRVYADLATIGFDKTSLVSWWDLNEETGTRYDAHGTNHLTASNTVLISPSVLNGGFETAGAGQALGSELLGNAGFETLGAGDPDFFGTWAEGGGTGATITAETTTIHGGTYAAKLTRAGANNASLSQDITVTASTRYKLTFWAAGDGSAAGLYGVYDLTNAAYIIASVTTGVTAGTYAQVTAYFTTPVGCISARIILLSPTSGSAYFDDVSIKKVLTDDVFGSWAETPSGSSTINDETSAVNSGSHACRFDIDASQNLPRITQNAAKTGDRYQISFYAKGSTNGIKMGASFANVSYTATLTTSYALYTSSLTSDSPTLTMFPYPTTANTSVYIDDITITDLGPVGIAGIAAGAATDGNFCGQFNGTTQYLSVADNAVLSPTGDFSFSVWVYLDNKSTNKWIVNKYDQNINAQRSFVMWYQLSTDRFRFLVDNGSGTASTVNSDALGSPSIGVWYHIVCRHTNGVGIGICVNNGTEDTAVHTAGVKDSTTLFTLGSTASNGGAYTTAPSDMLAGRLDSFLLGTKAFDATDRSTLFNSGKGIKPSSLTTAQRATLSAVVGYDLDKKPGITVDSIGTNTLTNNNAVTYGQGVDYYEGMVSKILDQSVNVRHATQTTNSKRPAYATSVQNSKAMMLFDGDDMLSFTAASLGTTNSVFVVVKPVALLGVVVGGSVGTYAMYIAATGVFYSVGGAFVSATHGMSAGTAYILGVVRDGTSVQFYKNGSTLGTVQTLSANTALAVDTLGANTSGANPYSGYLADPLLYSTALNPTQVANVFSVLNAKYQVF